MIGSTIGCKENFELIGGKTCVTESLVGSGHLECCNHLYFD